MQKCFKSKLELYFNKVIMHSKIKILSSFLTILAFGLFFVSTAYGSTTEKIVFNDGMEIKTINPDGTGVTLIGQGEMAQLSPDGTKIVFVKPLTIPCIDFSTVEYDIYTMNADGSNVTDLTSGQGQCIDRYPVWSPDGTKIAFVGQVQNTSNIPQGIWIMNADGSNLRELYSYATSGPSFSPDGTKIVFGKVEASSIGGIAEANADGSGYWYITNDGASWPSWSPDGRRIAFLNSNTLSTMNPDGTGRFDVTGSNYTTAPAWSPDSSTLAYVYNDHLLYKISASGGVPTMLYNGNVLNSVQWWSFHLNKAPIVNSISGATFNEGDTYSASASFTDPDSTSWTATVDYGDGSGTQSLALSGMNFSLSHQYKDEGTYTVTVSVTDNQGATGTGTATITVNNATPTVGTITVTPNPVQVNNAISASANFTDPGVLDTHTASWNWGDGNTTTGSVTETNGSGSVSNTHTYSTAGLYTVTLTVTDDDGLSATSTYQYVVVYDPSAGFLTGGGYYLSQAGWDTQNTQVSGQVNFGLNAKYTTGNNIPTGQTELNFKEGNINLHSTSYAWLVVSGAKATLKGTGTINGSGNYTFLISAIDGSQTGGQNLIRVKITDPSNNNNVIYDTQSGSADIADPTTALTNGSIKVH